MTTDTGEVAHIIRKQSDIFEAHFRNGDAAALVRDYYVDDPVMSAPDMPPIQGREAVTGLFEALVKDMSECRLEQVEVRVHDDVALEISRSFLKPRDTSQDEIECRYMIVWRKCPDTWRVEADFFAYGKIL